MIAAQGTALRREQDKAMIEDPTVFLAPMFRLKPGGSFGEAVEGIERKEYIDVDGLLDDGWTVD